MFYPLFTVWPLSPLLLNRFFSTLKSDITKKVYGNRFRITRITSHNSWGRHVYEKFSLNNATLTSLFRIGRIEVFDKFYKNNFFPISMFCWWKSVLYISLGTPITLDLGTFLSIMQSFKFRTENILLVRSFKKEIKRKSDFNN